MAVEENQRARAASSISGAQAFQLHDTYGFPIDLTLEMAAEQGLSVDEDGFRRLMDEQRERAKKDAAEKKTGNADISVYAALLEQAGKVTFTGYDQIVRRGDGRWACWSGGVPVTTAARGHRGRRGARPHPVLRRGRRPARRRRRDHDRRPGRPAEVEVTDVQTPLPGLVVHRGRVRSGEITTGAPAYAEIDIERRRATSRSHTATHLVHRALRGALGESAAQAGSENAPGRLRFDFTAHGRGAACGAARRWRTRSTGS